MISLFKFLFLIACLYCFFFNRAQAFPSANAPKQQRTPQDTGCLNYGHSCLGGHGKRSKIDLPLLLLRHIMDNQEESTGGPRVILHTGIPTFTYLIDDGKKSTRERNIQIIDTMLKDYLKSRDPVSDVILKYVPKNRSVEPLK